MFTLDYKHQYLHKAKAYIYVPLDRKVFATYLASGKV